MRFSHPLTGNQTHTLLWHFIPVVFFSCILALSARAQNSLSVTPTVIPPYSPNLDVWMSNPSRVLITILNLSGNSYDIRLHGSAKNNDGSLSMETKDEVATPVIHIGPHESKQLNLNDFRVFDPNVVRFKGTNTTIIARTHLLPDGVYSLCVQAIDYKTHTPLSPEQCASFQISNADAPMLLAPAHKSELDPRKSPIVQFQWIPPAQAPPGAVYQLDLLELQPNMEAEAAFRMPGNKHFSREIRGANMLTVQSGELQLQNGKMYAWRVHISDPMNTMSFHNDGYSAAWSFIYGNGGIIKKPKFIMPDTLLAGGFEIVVQNWDDSSRSTDPKLPSGTGCIKFNCAAKKVKFIPPYWLEVPLQSKSFNVIGTKVEDPLSQIHIMDAQHIDPSVKAGDKILLDLPSNSLSKASQISDINKYLGWLNNLYPAGCILVGFHDVDWTAPTKKTVVLTGGIAAYPTNPPTPNPPAMLVLDSGFTLAIDSLVITPVEATVQGNLLLPKNIISADTCTRAFVKLPKTTITANCEFYKEVAQDSGFGRWWIGNTGLLVHGNRYIVDFSSSQSAPGVTPPLAPSWKGVLLRDGSNDAMPSLSMISNRGYIKAPFNFTNAAIVKSGFQGILKFSGSPWKFTSLEPYGYQVELTEGALLLDSSFILAGRFLNGRIAAPRAAVTDNGGTTLVANYAHLRVQRNMDLFGPIIYDGAFLWGEYSRTTDKPTFYVVSKPATAANPDSGSFFLSAAQLKPYYPADSNWHHPILYPALAALEIQGIQGMTFPYLTARDFSIMTPDVPGSSKQIIFHKDVFAGMWMNIIRSGIHGEVEIVCDSSKEKDYKLGDSLRIKYDGKTSFKTDFGLCPPTKRSDFAGATFNTNGFASNKRFDLMPFQFCESAVWNSELAGEVKLPVPASVSIKFKNMMFTSSADCAGGQVDLSKPDSLPYWGVQMVAKDTTKSAGIICARLGVIYLTATGIAEPRHYAKPFWLTWGELKADGNLGKMFFDYNSVGQRFDGFPFSPSFVKLSDYQAVDKDTAKFTGMNLGALRGFLHAYGALSVHFFGAKNISLSDYNLPGASGGAYPYANRWVRLQSTSILNTPASDIHWQRNWAGGIANFDYTSIVYDSLIQDGFLGSGTANVLEITGGMSSTITIKAERSCFSIIAEASHQLNLAVVANFSDMEKIWGCGCIVGDNLEKVVIGAEVSTGGGLGSSLAARVGGMLSIKLSFLPTQTRLQLQGDMYALIASSINAEVSGSAEFVEDWSVGYVEGTLQGKVQFSTFLSGIDAEGELQWHFGSDYEMLQGKVAIGMYGPATLGLQSGVFLGVNCPASKIWVTDDIDGRFSLNKNMLPTDSHGNLSGMYAYLSIETSINLYIVSGGYQVYAGMGAFFSSGGFGVVGNVGVRIWGEILGGLISASAWGDLQLLAGIPPAFQGTIGLEACALWVFCGSVTVHGGYNHVQGFYLN